MDHRPLEGFVYAIRRSTSRLSAATAHGAGAHGQRGRVEAVAHRRLSNWNFYRCSRRRGCRGRDQLPPRRFDRGEPPAPASPTSPASTLRARRRLPEPVEVHRRHTWSTTAVSAHRRRDRGKDFYRGPRECRTRTRSRSRWCAGPTSTRASRVQRRLRGLRPDTPLARRARPGGGDDRGHPHGRRGRLPELHGGVIDRRAFTRIRDHIRGGAPLPGVRVLAGGAPTNSVGFFVQPTCCRPTIRGPHEVRGDLRTGAHGPRLPRGQVERDAPLGGPDEPYALTGAVFSRDRAALLEADPARSGNAAGTYTSTTSRTGAVVGQQPFAARGRAGRRQGRVGHQHVALGPPRSIKETLVPPKDYRYPSWRRRSHPARMTWPRAASSREWVSPPRKSRPNSAIPRTVALRTRSMSARARCWRPKPASAAAGDADT